MADLADDVIFVPPVESFLQPLVAIVPLQLLAYHIAVLRGCDVDKPAELGEERYGGVIYFFSFFSPSGRQISILSFDFSPTSFFASTSSSVKRASKTSPSVAAVAVVGNVNNAVGSLKTVGVGDPFALIEYQSTFQV